MKILILCDRESVQPGTNLCLRVQETARETGSDVDVRVLNGEDIISCSGCFQCWVRTPGLCVVMKDDANTIAGQFIRSDAVIFLSKIVYGGYSYDIKSMMERTIPNISPFFEKFQGGLHHKMRYKQFPCIISIGYGAVTDKERQTFSTLSGWNALSMRPSQHFHFILPKGDELQETLDALKQVLSQDIFPQLDLTTCEKG